MNLSIFSNIHIMKFGSLLVNILESNRSLNYEQIILYSAYLLQHTLAIVMNRFDILLFI